MSELIIPKYTVTESACDSDVCKTCKGMGRILYTPSAKEFEWLYGTSGIEPQPFVKDCPDCKGKYNKYSAEGDLTNVPDLMREADITKFDFTRYSKDMTKLKSICEDFVNNYKKWEGQGKGLYLWSKTPGSGKTFLACCLGKSVMVKENLRFKFITVPDYIDKVGERMSIAKSGGFDDPSKIYRDCELLVFDDIGAQLGKEWQQSEIFKLVNERQAKGLITIFTSNLHFDNLNIDDRAKSRIMRSTICIQMPEESIRSQLAREEQEEFLKGVL